MAEAYKNIYSQRLAGYLMLQGFVLKGMGENIRYKGRNVFFFNDTPEINEAIDEFLQNRKV